MPVDKLGRHFLRTPPYNFPWRQQSDTLVLCQPSLKSECVLKISSVDQVSTSVIQTVLKAPVSTPPPKEPQKSDLNYVLENEKHNYKLPVSGTIKGITIFPADTKIVLNGSNTLQSHWTLLEKEIKKGDTLSFFATNITNLRKRLFVELVIHCPLIREDEH